MSALSKDRAGIVKALIEAAPDSAIRSLEIALSGDVAGGSPGGSPTGGSDPGGLAVHAARRIGHRVRVTLAS